MGDAIVVQPNDSACEQVEVSKLKHAESSMSQTTAPMLTPAQSDDDNTDTSTASSVLNLSAYKSTTWTGLISYGVPTVGLAVLAVTHPLLLVAGATVSLLGMGGAYAVNAPDCLSMCGRTEEPTKIEELEPDSRPMKEFTIETTCVRSPDESEIEHKLCSATTDLDEPFEIPPPFQHVILEKAEFQSLHAKDFFQVFVGDDAPFSFKDFQRQRGDVNIVYNPWAGTNKRIITFQTPTKTPFFGPSFATATKVQELAHHSKRCVILLSTTSLHDIPFSDRFVVREQWVLQSNADRVCTLRVSVQIDFSKPCSFESQIVSKSTSTLQEVLLSWKAMAQKALVLTEKRKHEEEMKLDDEIEVAYQHERRRSCVLGDEIVEEEEEDWEMDPVALPKERRSSIQSIRRSIATKFKKKP